MANENDILGVSANIDASGTKKGSNEYVEAISRMEKSTDGLLDKTSKLETELSSAKKSAEKAASSIQGLGKVVESSISQTTRASKKEIDELAARFDMLQSKLSASRQKLNRAGESLSAAHGRADELGYSQGSFERGALTAQAQGNYDRAKKEFQEILAEVTQVRQEFNALNKSAEQVPEKAVSIQAQIRKITDELAQMKAAQEEGTDEWEEKLEKVAELKKLLQGVRKEVDVESKPDSGFQAFGEGVSVATGAVTAATGALSLFGATSKSAQEITAKLTSVMSISMGIQQMMAVTYETSALKAKLLALYKKANAEASIEESAANVGATATTGALAAGETVATGTTITLTGAMKALGLAIKSIPLIGWVLAGISALVAGGIALYDNYAEKKEKADEKMKKSAEERVKREKELEQERHSVTVKTVSKQMASYNSLQNAWKRLKTEQEKADFIKQHVSDFDALGASINGVSDAEDFLINNTANVQKAFLLRAEAAAAAAQAEKAVEQYFNTFDSLNGGSGHATVKKNELWGNLTDADKASIGTDVATARKEGYVKSNKWGAGILTEKGAQKVVAARALANSRENQAAIKAAEEEKDRAVNKAFERINSANEQLKKLGFGNDSGKSSAKYTPSRGGSVGGRSGGGGPTKNELYNEAYLNSIAENEDEVNELRRRNELLEEMESQHQQRLLDIREDGYSKSMASLEKELDDEIDEIKESLADEILTVQQYYKDKYLEEEKARAEKTKGKITPWDDSMLANNKEYQDYITELLKRGDVLINDAQKANVEKQKQVLKKLLASYQDFEAQKLAAEIKFNEEVKSLEEAREAAQKEGRVEDVIAINASITALQSKYRESVGQLTAENFFKTSGLDRLFGNISMLSSRQLGDIQSKLKERMSQGGLGIDEYETLAKKAQEVEDLLFSRQKKAYNFMGGTLMEVLRERARLTKETADAEEQLADAEARLAESAASVMSAKVEIWNALGGASSGYALSDITTDNQKSILANNTSNAALPALFAKLVGVTQQQQENGAIVKERKSIVGALKKRENETPQGKAARQVATANYAAGQAREAAGLVDKLKEQGVFGSGEAAERIGAAFSSAASAGEAYAKFMQGDFVGALSSGLDAVLNLFTVFGIGKGNMAELQEEIDHLTAATADLSSAFTLLSKELEESTTLTARENKEKAIANLQQQKENTQKTAADRLAQWERGSRSLGSKVDRDADAQAALREMGLSSVYDLTKLSSEQLQDLMKNYSGGAWTTLMDSLRRNNNEHNGDAEAFISELEFLSEIDDKITEVEEKAYEKYTGFTFQGLKDSFVSTLQDMNSSLDDFAAEAEKRMNNIALQKIADSLDDDLEGWYKEYAKAIEDAGENGLTPEQEANFKAKYDAIVQRALDQREAAEEAGIITQTAQNKAGMTKGFGSMTVEQADYLTGTFTSVMVSNQGILVTVQEALEQIKSQSITSVTMGENVQQMRDTMTEMRDIQQEGLQYTKQIAEYTLNLVVMKSDIERMRVALETKL